MNKTASTMVAITSIQRLRFQVYRQRRTIDVELPLERMRIQF